MNLPTETQCRSYFVDYKVPVNICQHCHKVQEVAVFLARKVQDAGEAIDVALVSRLALLHDLFKMVAIKEFGVGPHKDAIITKEEIDFWHGMRQKYAGRYEGDVAYLVFKDTFPEFAETLRRVSNPRNENPTWEELLVHYADWRVFQNKVVPLNERLLYLRRQYPREESAWKAYTEKIKRQEQQIMQKIHLHPEDLNLEDRGQPHGG
ncbi:hypothetical protein HYU22_03080 [Candidatus Woesearchaeota archaeon]|nr:hypothetical protein [Candidatus Woesearchaeota archaeon]